MRHVHKQVGNRRDEMQMAYGVDDDVRRVKESQKPEEDACPSRAHKSADERQETQAEVSYVDKCRHGKQTEHFAIRVHDARHIVQRIHEQKEQGEAESAFL